jgi:hypothetical protein
MLRQTECSGTVNKYSAQAALDPAAISPASFSKVLQARRPEKGVRAPGEIRGTLYSAHSLYLCNWCGSTDRALLSRAELPLATYDLWVVDLERRTARQ